MLVAHNGTARLGGHIFPRNFSAPLTQFFMNLGINNNIYLLQLGCYPVTVVILHVNKT